MSRPAAKEEAAPGREVLGDCRGVRGVGDRDETEVEGEFGTELGPYEPSPVHRLPLQYPVHIFLAMHLHFARLICTGRHLYDTFY